MLSIVHCAARGHALRRGGGPVLGGRADPPRPGLQHDLHHQTAPGRHRHLRHARGRVV